MNTKQPGSFSWEIPPFYTPGIKGSGHSNLPTLLAQSEISVHQPLTLLATQEIGPTSHIVLSDHHECSRIHFHGPSATTTPVPTSKNKTRSRSEPLSPSTHTPTHHSAVHFEEPASTTGASDSAHCSYSVERCQDTPLASSRRTASPASCDDNDNSDTNGIPKPLGEVGRPSRGGYTLSKVLGWPPKDYGCAKVFSILLISRWKPSTYALNGHPRDSLRRLLGSILTHPKSFQPRTEMQYLL